MINPRVVYVLFMDGFSVRYLARLFKEQPAEIEQLLRTELKRRRAR